jgi:hypothetical protein
MSGRLLLYVMPGADRRLMVANSSQDIKEFTSVCVGDVMTLEWAIVITAVIAPLNSKDNAFSPGC